jgi:nucleotide-binding universal stress UspA family protein
MEPTRIIVGVDFSPESELAAHQAVEVARHLGAELVLIHAGETLELPVLDEESSPAARQAFEETYRTGLARALASRREELASLRERLSGQGPIISQMMVEGFADAALCRAADELGAGLIVVGTHGRTGLRWFFLGSVAEHVVRGSSTDVLVARKAGAGRGGYRRILVATDFTPASERALDRALDLAAADAHVDVVHFYNLVLPPVLFASVATVLAPTDRLSREIAAEMSERGEKLLAGRRRPGLELEFHAITGAPVPGLVHQLEAMPYDLAALGSSGRRGFRVSPADARQRRRGGRAPRSLLGGHRARRKPGR